MTNQVDATILEVGIGGTYDCTNTVPRPIVTGVSSLGIDHVGVLGNTIGEIAWQKGGIFKVSVLVALHHASYKSALRKAFRR
jgi:folylpolyglutamate synthase